VLEYIRPWAHFATLIGIPVALFIAIGNAIWQSHLQRVRLRHDLFDKRFEIYCTLRDFIHKLLMSNGSVETADVQALAKHAAAAEFLFGPPIVTFMEEACHKALALEVWAEMGRKRGQELPESEKKKRQDTVAWFSTEATARLKLFPNDLTLHRR